MTFTTTAKPLSYYASHSALGIAAALEVEFGSHLLGLSLEDAKLFRAALALLLAKASTPLGFSVERSRDANRTISCSAVPANLQGYFRAIEDIDTAGIESLLLAVTQQIYSNNWN
ncbi:hypothetical protein IQ258_19075 [Coleofasciculus sp. LEGE 07081]|uniref:hypothetical protein n=1 Tax=Coleofasciculus sp. LEGE 07081 TaxID=2777967 RepID=UPI00187FEEF6|nr:hypothetical protein [Coleofasciculus sp. LEGE 07081]MBE9128208.1 hypothetical protein [Coleofasciculus sp. LEGE 07081]